LRKELYNPMF